MTRQEFLEELRSALEIEVSRQVLEDNVKFYDEFIRNEVRKGKTEVQVLEELGSPRLIAHTIIDVESTSDGHKGYSEYSQNSGMNENEYSNDYQKNGGSEYYSNGWNSQDGNEGSGKGLHFNYSDENGWDIRFGRFKLNSWYGKLLGIILVISFFVIVIFLLNLLLPYLLILGAVLFLISLISNAGYKK